MITFVVGTRAQLIKMAPVMREMESIGTEYRLLMTGQHQTTMSSLLEEFGVRTAPNTLYNGKEISGIARVAWWFPVVLARLIGVLRTSRGTEPSCVVVHGDTFSTLLGALAGRIVGLKVVHVESGLRSFNWLHPFPEEITRLLVFRLTDVAFCPGKWARDNMTGYSARSIDTEANTLLDSLRYAINHPDPVGDMPLPDVYCVASIHRFENIFSRQRFLGILDTIEKIAAHCHVVFVLHPATRRRLEKLGQHARMKRNSRISLVDRMTYLPFIRVISRAEFVVTDGGSNQEELSYLGIPALLMRAATERKEGIGGNVVVSNYDPAIIDDFLTTHGTRRSTGSGLVGLRLVQPSARVAQALTGMFTGSGVPRATAQS